jgi:hypothetical protein
VLLDVGKKPVVGTVELIRVVDTQLAGPHQLDDPRGLRDEMTAEAEGPFRSAARPDGP